jgi:hypothetical protein
MAQHRAGVRYLGAVLIGNLVWETLHLPLYTLWQAGTATYLTFVAIHCSVGDLMIATTALAALLRWLDEGGHCETTAVWRSSRCCSVSSTRCSANG